MAVGVFMANFFSDKCFVYGTQRGKDVCHNLANFYDIKAYALYMCLQIIYLEVLESNGMGMTEKRTLHVTSYTLHSM